MKKITILFVWIALFSGLSAQVKSDDFGRIILNTYLPEELTLPGEAKDALINKLNQISSNNGMGGSQVNPRFIITANITVGTKDIIAGPPQMIALNLDITLFVGDALTNTIYSNMALSLKGVGTNENKAYIEAIKMINPKNKEVIAFLEDGKNKIIKYYAEQCDFIINEAQTLVKLQQYNKAIHDLSLVPEVCKDCYFKCLDTLQTIYQKKIDADGRVYLNEAKTLWTVEQNAAGAEKAGDKINAINPSAACQPEVIKLMQQIEAKLKADEREKWLFKKKQYEDRIALQKQQIRIAEEKLQRDNDLDKLRVSAYRDIALEQAINQPRTVTYNRIYWR
jgi:hypothetical protein